jgi:hypothetical protein
MKGKENLKPTKTCFGHIGGKLGTMLMKAFTEKGWNSKIESGR